MLKKKTFFFSVLLSILLICTDGIDIRESYAGHRKKPQPLVEGDIFMGGAPPQFAYLGVAKEVKNHPGYYLIKAIVKRASGDRDGSMPLLTAKTYGDLIARWLNVNPESKRLFDKMFPYSIDKKKFQPVLLKYKYTIIVGKRNSKGEFEFLFKSTALQEKKGKRKFREVLSRGLKPGNYLVGLHVSVELGSHPMLTAYTTAEWVIDFYKLITMGPLALAKDKIVNEYTKWFTLTGLSKEMFKYAFKKRMMEQWVVYPLTVWAKVPNMKRMRPSTAMQELLKQNLKYQLKDTTHCPRKWVNKVYSHKPGARKKVKAGTAVTLTICRDKKKPTPTPDCDKQRKEIQDRCANFNIETPKKYCEFFGIYFNCGNEPVSCHTSLLEYGTNGWCTLPGYVKCMYPAVDAYFNCLYKCRDEQLGIINHVRRINFGSYCSGDCSENPYGCLCTFLKAVQRCQKAASSAK